MPETSSSGTSIRRHARNRFFFNFTFFGMERVYRTILARSSGRDTIFQAAAQILKSARYTLARHTSTGAARERVYPADDGLDVGEDSGAPVSEDCGPTGNAFNGRIKTAMGALSRVRQTLRHADGRTRAQRASE
jgi:hypothetical protein